jgi:hypothetical protein
MSDQTDFNRQPDGPQNPDPMGLNIPPNERVVRDAPWQPDFTPLGARPTEPPAQPAAEESPDMWQSPQPTPLPPSAPTHS